MSVIRAAHWTEQRICGHFRTRHVLLQIKGDGPPQIREACVDCGKCVGPAELKKQHPKSPSYPVLIPHPRPCECHTNEKPTKAVVDYATYLASPEWRERRRYYYAKALHRCELCGHSSDAMGRGLNVHHRTYERLGREFDADVIVLCRACHEKFHDVASAA